MTKTHVLPWIKQLKDLLWICCTCLKTLKVGACVSVLAEFWMKTWWAAVYNMYIFTISFLLSVHTSACTSTTQMYTYTCIHVHLHVRAYVPIHAHMQAHTGKQAHKHTRTHGQRNHMAIFSLWHVRTPTHKHTQAHAVSSCISFSDHFWQGVTFLWSFLVLYSPRTTQTWRLSWSTCACWSPSPAPATGRPSGWKQVSECRHELHCCCCSIDWTWVCVDVNSVASVAAAVPLTGR